MSTKTCKFERRYGLTVDQYNAMLEGQYKSCKICGSHEDDFYKNLYVDHCHATGKVRGLLCHTCNAGLGMFKDDPDLLSTAIDYLKEFEYE